MKCHNCNLGTIRQLARPGRTAPYKSIPNLAVPADLAIATCDHCGEEWMTPGDAERIDAAMEVSYRQELLGRLRTVLPDADQASRIERDLGLSRGYLSRLRRATRPPSEALLAILALFRQDPAAIGQVEAFWRQQAKL